MLMKTDNLGIPRFTNKDLIDMIYSGHIDKCHVVLCDPSDDIEKFNELAKEHGKLELKKYIPIDVEQKDFDNVCQSEWFMPESYKDKDMYDFCKHKIMDEKYTSSYATAEFSPEYERAVEELDEFEKRGMMDLLRYMVYLVDFMRAEGIVWGVGRGSSVASYVLYLIGIHKVNSIQYQLDWHEFLR